MMQKWMTLALLLTVLLGTVSCSGGETETQMNTDETPAAETEGTTQTETELSDDLPEKTFDGMDFRMLSYETVNCNGIHVVEEMTGEGVNDATFQMNKALEDRFKVVFSETLDGNLCLTGIQKTILAGDHAYELIFPNTNSTFAFLQKHCVLNYDALPYVNLEKPYWVETINKDVSIGGQFFYAMGGLDLSHLDYTHMMTFSKDMVKNYDLEDFYTLVHEGKWTLDKMEEAMKAVSNDPDPKKDEPTDVYGFISSPKQVLPDFWEAAGAHSIGKDETDTLYYAIPGNETFATIVDRVFRLMWDTGYWMQTKTDDNVPPELNTIMEEGRVLFADTTFHYVKNLRELDADFGLLPYPKWDEAQQEYHSRLEGGVRCPMVPVTADDPEYISIIMEAMSFAGYRNLVPAYFEEGLKGKVSRDAESSQILDLIYDTRIYDLGDTIWINDIRDGFMRAMFKDNKRDLASTVEKTREKIEKSLAEAMEVCNNE